MVLLKKFGNVLIFLNFTGQLAELINRLPLLVETVEFVLNYTFTMIYRDGNIWMYSLVPPPPPLPFADSAVCVRDTYSLLAEAN